MTTLRISDSAGYVLDLAGLLKLLAPKAMQAVWTITPVKAKNDPKRQWFEATGLGGLELERLSEARGKVSGAQMFALARETHQVIWGEFEGALADNPEWVLIRAIDSSFFEVVTSDTTVLAAVQAWFPENRVLD